MNTQKRPTVSDGAHDVERGGLVVEKLGTHVVVNTLDGFGGCRIPVRQSRIVGETGKELERFTHRCALLARGAPNTADCVLAVFNVPLDSIDGAKPFSQMLGVGVRHLVSSSALAASVASQLLTLRFWRAASASMAAHRLGVKRIDFAMGALGEVGNELTIFVANLDEELTGVVRNDGVGPIIVSVQDNRSLSSGSRGVEANGGRGQNQHLGNSYVLIPERYHVDTSNATKVKTILKESWEAA